MDQGAGALRKRSLQASGLYGGLGESNRFNLSSEMVFKTQSQRSTIHFGQRSLVHLTGQQTSGLERRFDGLRVIAAKNALKANASAHCVPLIRMNFLTTK